LREDSFGKRQVIRAACGDYGRVERKDTQRWTKREPRRCCPKRLMSTARRSSAVKAACLAGALRHRDRLRRSTL